ncbi:hypothetical protein DL767_006568 [Monosporascus sp. MG133]|nr:hypothetical protein DL767_006568 [Monosporascus sp. MG133]
MLQKVAPETYDGEHDSIASMLLRNSVSKAESARLKALLYQLPNKMELALEPGEELTDAQVIKILTVAAIKEDFFVAAIRCHDVELANQLLAAGRAAEARNVGLVKVLIRAGTKVDLILQEHGLSPLELACGTATPSAHESALRTVSELVANGAAIDGAADPSRPTALLLAVASGNADLVEYILESGAEITRYIGATSCCFNAPALAICSQDLEKVLLYLGSPEKPSADYS